jgi:DNA-binding phage protein
MDDVKFSRYATADYSAGKRKIAAYLDAVIKDDDPVLMDVSSIAYPIACLINMAFHHLLPKVHGWHDLEKLAGQLA